jgi:hypothetical protein
MKRTATPIHYFGPVAQTGIFYITARDYMFGQTNCYDRSLDARDAKIAKLKSRLSLAYASRNKAEQTRLTKQLTRLGHSL